MKHPATYPIKQALVPLAAMTGIDIKDMLRSVGLPESFFEQPKCEVSGQVFYDLWNTTARALKAPHTPFSLGQGFARQSCAPAQVAYAASANLRQGIARLSLFKPLVAPFTLDVSETPDSFDITLKSALPHLQQPPHMLEFELAYFITLFRESTNALIKPRAIGLPVGCSFSPQERAYYGVTPVAAAQLTLSLSREDANLPLISANPTLLGEIEPQLQSQLAAKQATQGGLHHRISQALHDMLPAGVSGLDAAADRLHMSRRSLQRHLKAEGISYQTMLETTRADLAKAYLKRNDISVTEIAYLLAFRDPNSFYRAFHSWTGMTPLQARTTL